jgi:hypothetical protein
MRRPYRIGERVRALKLLRSVTNGMLLMWDRGLHSYAMVQATVVKGCDYLGRIPANVKFLVEEPLADGSYLSWIYPNGKLRKQGWKPLLLRVIEYTIEHPEQPTEQLTYRLITSLVDIERFPAQLLASEYHQRWEVENTIDELKIHLLGRKTHVRSQKPRSCRARGLWLVVGTLGSTVINIPSSDYCASPAVASEFYGNLTSHPPCPSQISTLTKRRIALFFDLLIVEILDQLLPQRVHRTNPRVVKKPVSKFRSKKVEHRSTGQRIDAPTFRILTTAFSLN